MTVKTHDYFYRDNGVNFVSFSVNTATDVYTLLGDAAPWIRSIYSPSQLNQPDLGITIQVDVNGNVWEGPGSPGPSY